ncbi:uncharacterized protein BCR38DRAFT_329421, partial [Pseudomassariella vexata]
ERYREDLVNLQNYGRLQISIIVWGMIWLRDDEGGASKLVFYDGDLDSPRSRVSLQSARAASILRARRFLYT